jgi:Pentapeptide repeats (8 copies)
VAVLTVIKRRSERSRERESANAWCLDLSGAVLKQTDRRGEHLEWANLSDTGLSGANLSGAYLLGADLRGANLSGANLSGAYLTRAELTNVRLNIADLSGAHLEWAALGGACLEWANLSGTYPDKPPWEDRAESPYSPGPTTTAGGSVEMPPSAGKQLLPDRLRATRRGMLRNALPPLCRTFE